MIRRIFIISLLVIAIPAICFAAADQSRAAAVGGNVDQIVAIGDASSGYLAEVNSETGAVSVTRSARAVTSQTEDALVYTGACKVQLIQVRGIAAGDLVLVYDALSASGTPKFDIAIAVANDSKCINVGGASFATGIYVDHTAAGAKIFSSVVYDY